MSKEKKYTLTYDDEDNACISEFLENGEPLTDRAVADLLNQKDHQIKQCEKENKELIQEINDLYLDKGDAEYYKGLYEEKCEENKELKQRIQKVKEYLTYGEMNE